MSQPLTNTNSEAPSIKVGSQVAAKISKGKKELPDDWILANVVNYYPNKGKKTYCEEEEGAPLLYLSIFDIVIMLITEY